MDALPSDVLRMVLALLDARSLLNVSTMCWRLRQLSLEAARNMVDRVRPVARRLPHDAPPQTVLREAHFVDRARGRLQQGRAAAVESILDSYHHLLVGERGEVWYWDAAEASPIRLPSLPPAVSITRHVMVGTDGCVYAHHVKPPSPPNPHVRIDWMNERGSAISVARSLDSDIVLFDSGAVAVCCPRRYLRCFFGGSVVPVHHTVLVSTQSTGWDIVGAWLDAPELEEGVVAVFGDASSDSGGLVTATGQAWVVGTCDFAPRGITRFHVPLPANTRAVGVFGSASTREVIVLAEGGAVFSVPICASTFVNGCVRPEAVYMVDPCPAEGEEEFAFFEGESGRCMWSQAQWYESYGAPIDREVSADFEEFPFKEFPFPRAEIRSTDISFALGCMFVMSGNRFARVGKYMGKQHSFGAPLVWQA